MEVKIIQHHKINIMRWKRIGKIIETMKKNTPMMSRLLRFPFTLLTHATIVSF